MKDKRRPISKIFPFKTHPFVSYPITVTMLLTVLLFASIGGSYEIESVEGQLTNTSSISELIEKGDSLFNQGRYEEAITYFDKVLALDPNDTDMLYYKGISLESQGKHDEAITYFDKVLALDPNDTDTLTYKGISLESQGKHDEAITYFDKVLALDPNNENTLSWKEHTLRKMGKYDDTVTNLVDQAYPTDTNNTELNDAKDKAKGIIKNILNTIFPQTGEKFSNTNYGVDMTFPKNWTGFEMKIILPMAVVSPEGFNITSLFSGYIDSLVDNMAETIIANNTTELSDQQFRELFEPKVRESVESFSKNLMEYMENKTSIMEIAIYDKELMQFITSVNPNITMSADSLTSLYEQFVASDPTVSCDRKTLNRTVLNNNMSAEVSTEDCLLVSSNEYANNLNYFVLTPNAIVGIHYSTDSNIEYDKFLSKFEESLRSLSVEESLPINNQTIQQFLDVKTSISQSANTSNDDELDIKLQNRSAILQKGVELEDLGRYEDAISWYDKVLEVYPKDKDILFNKGVMLQQLGKYREAITWYDKSLEIDPTWVGSLNNKAISLAELGKNEEAIIWYDKVIEINPYDVDAFNNKGISLGDLGKYEEAVSSFDKALKIESDNLFALTFKGAALGELGKTQDALASLDKALTIDPTNQEALNLKSLIQK